MWVTKETLKISNDMAEGVTTETETVAQALRELALLYDNQDKLSEFLTDNFASDDHEVSSCK